MNMNTHKQKILLCFTNILFLHAPGVTLSNVTSLNIFELNVNFDKFTIRLHYLYIFFMLTKFQGDQRSIVMSSINCLNSNFCSLK